MGNKLSTDAEHALERFNKDMDTVGCLVLQGKEAEELQEFKTSSAKYNEAIVVLYKLLSEDILPNRICQETKELVWDLLDKCNQQKVYEKCLNIANQPRLDVIEKAINSNEDVEYGSDCEDEAVEYNFQQLKRDVDSIPTEDVVNQRSRFQLQLAMSKKELESSDSESEEEDENEVPCKKFSEVESVLKAAVSEAGCDTTCEDPAEAYLEVKGIADELRKKYNLNCEESQFQQLLLRTVWERDQAKRVLALERTLIEQQLRDAITNRGKGESQNQGASFGSGNNQVQCKEDSCGSDAEKEQKELTERIQRLVKKPNGERNVKPKLDDVIGLKAVKKMLQTGVLDPIDRPYLVSSGIMTPLSGMLLYGPPGTGKSMVAQALANEATNCSYMQIGKSDITSKWQGESEKLVSTLFKVAKESSPCIIFIDEVEALLMDRNQKGGGSTLVTDLLTNMQHLGQQGVFILAATNCPWDIDLAFLRRFNAVFYVPLPSLHDRITIFENALKPKMDAKHVELAEVTQTDLEKLALLTPNYSGGHIRLIVEAAQILRLNRTKQATHFRQSPVYKGKMQPCGPNEPGAKEMQYKNVKNVHYPPITMFDMEKALYCVKAQIDVEQLRKLIEWGRKNSSMATE